MLWQSSTIKTEAWNVSPLTSAWSWRSGSPPLVSTLSLTDSRRMTRFNPSKNARANAPMGMDARNRQLEHEQRTAVDDKVGAILDVKVLGKPMNGGTSTAPEGSVST